MLYRPVSFSNLRFILAFPFLFVLGGCFSRPPIKWMTELDIPYSLNAYQAIQLSYEAERNPARFEKYLDGGLVTAWGIVREVKKNYVEVSSFKTDWAFKNQKSPLSTITCKIRKGYQDTLLSLNPNKPVIVSGILDFSADGIFQNIYLRKCLVGLSNRKEMPKELEYLTGLTGGSIEGIYVYGPYSSVDIQKHFWNSPGPKKYLKNEMKVTGKQELNMFYQSVYTPYAKLSREFREGDIGYKGRIKQFCSSGDVCNYFLYE